MRKTAMAIAFSVAVIMLAPIVSAGGGNGNGNPNGNGNWGKKDLPLTVDFVPVASSSYGDAYGYMNWSPTLDVFKFDFHAYYVQHMSSGEAVYYCLTYTTSATPSADDEVLGWGSAALCQIEGSDVVRVHIKGEVAWPGVGGATLNLVGYPKITVPGDPPTYEYQYTVFLESFELVDLVKL